MELPEYITVEEVKRVCGYLGLSDWSAKTDAEVADEEAAIVMKVVNTKGMAIPLVDFRLGLEVELEHGTRFADANVTNNHPILTGRIVLAHLKETLDYYQRLDVAELEGDLLKAVMSGKVEKIEDKFRKLVAAQGALNKAVADRLRKGK